MQLATIVGIFMVILIVTIAILRVRKKGDEDEHLLDEYNEQEQTFTDLQNDIPKQEEPSSGQSSGLDTQNTEYEWQEHPVGTGHWYYRSHGEEEWTYYEQ
jgi:flagellar biosynthesis/type III secretory pathway M-ring protein FliF/YscJ